MLLGSTSTISSSTLSVSNPGVGVGVIISSSLALLASVSILITNECFSKLKIRYTNLRDWMNVITILYDEAMKNSITD